MSYLKSDRFTLPSDPAYWVRMKKVMSTGDWLVTRDFWRTYPLPHDQESEEYKVATAQREVDAAKHVISLVILEWNLTDADDVPMEIVADNLPRLPREDFIFLEEKATQVMAGRPVEAEAPFAKRSGKSSRATKSKRHPS